MEGEIDIISLIQSRRYMNAALRYLLPQHKIDELKSQTKYVEIDLDAAEDSQQVKEPCFKDDAPSLDCPIDDRVRPAIDS